MLIEFGVAREVRQARRHGFSELRFCGPSGVGERFPEQSFKVFGVFRPDLVLMMR